MSKQFVRISEINVEPRQRKEFSEKANQDLQHSLQSVGLLHAPVCGGQNCQVAQQSDEADEPQPEMLVGHSEMQGGWCVYVQSARAEYDVVRGPFPSQDQAYASMDRLLARSNTPNAKLTGLAPEGDKS